MSNRLELLPSPDEVRRICSQCGRSIVTARLNPDGTHTSEYQDRKGRCFKCSTGAKQPHQGAKRAVQLAFAFGPRWGEGGG